jgi:hypothetical protein
VLISIHTKVTAPIDERRAAADTDPLTLITRFFASLFPGKRCSFSAAEYTHGDHITKHDDHAYVMHTADPYVIDSTPIKCSRDVAVIYYVNPDWTQDDGGMLVDLVDGKRYLPVFNSMVAFMVPRLHEVTKVRERQGREPRRSIFGWFLEPGDIYKFVPEEGEGGGGGGVKGDNGQAGAAADAFGERDEEVTCRQRRKRSRFDEERALIGGGLLSEEQKERNRRKKRAKKKYR